MNQTKIKIQKPIEIDAHLKYRCHKCGWDHWVSLNQSKTKNYKVVCDCGTVFSPKRIKNLTINYRIRKKKIESISQNTETIIVDQVQHIKHSINSETLEKCSLLLIKYGFTKAEAKNLITDSYNKIGSDNISVLFKDILQSIGDKK
jgi:hypothetical protein